MTQTNQFNRLADVFENARVLQDDRRREYLDHECAGDEDLRAQVESLLERHDQQGLLDTPVQTATSLTVPMPDRIGRFRVIERLGRGGMGVVYRAEQDHPHREVALKMMHAGLSSEELRRRFEFEASVLARLQHPGIAQIYEVDTWDDGSGLKPFFAMELVDGAALDDFLRQRRLTLAEKLRLFMAICEAVQHAHQKGIIHRDLKPANILVNAEGTPKILDFGVARATDADLRATVHTTPGQLIGTLAYMSPEQVSGVSERLDTRSDVYALGVIFYEMLTGSLPYDVANKPLTQVARVISETVPPPLTAVDRSYRGDLTTISGKMLEKDPDRRYSSVSELVADIRRFLACEPISARPASAVYQLRKFAQRNKGLVWGAAAALFALVIGLSFSVSALRVASRERDENDAVTQFLAAMLSSADPGQEGRNARVIDLLEAASSRLNEASLNEPLVAAKLHQVIGATYLSLGVYDVAETHLKQAYDSRSSLLGVNAPETLDSMRELGALYCAWGKYPQSEELLKRAFELGKKTLGKNDERTLAAMAELGTLYRNQGRYDLALPLHKECVDLRREYYGKENPETLKAMNNLGLVYKRMGDFKKAERLYRETLVTRQRVLGTEHVDTLTSMNNLAHLFRSLDRPQDAAALHAKTLAIRRRKLGDDHPHTLMSMDNLAMVLSDLGRYDEARALYEEALERKRRVFGEEHPQTLVTMNNLANLYLQLKNFDDAERLHRETLEIRRRTLGERNEDTAMSMVNLARVLSEVGKYDEAAKLYEEAIDIRRELLGPDHPDLAYTLHRYGWLQIRRGQYASAEKLIREARDIYERRKDPSRENVVFMNVELARALKMQKRFAEAESLLLSAQDAITLKPGDDTSDLIFSSLVTLYESWDAAEPGKGYHDKAEHWRIVGKVRGKTVVRP